MLRPEDRRLCFNAKNMCLGACVFFIFLLRLFLWGLTMSVARMAWIGAFLRGETEAPGARKHICTCSPWLQVLGGQSLRLWGGKPGAFDKKSHVFVVGKHVRKSADSRTPSRIMWWKWKPWPKATKTSEFFTRKWPRATPVPWFVKADQGRTTKSERHKKSWEKFGSHHFFSKLSVPPLTSPNSRHKNTVGSRCGKNLVKWQ